MTNTVSSAAEMKTGDIYQVVLDAGESQVIDMDGVAQGAQFELAILNLATSGNVTTALTSSDASVLANLAADHPEDEDGWEDPSLQEAFDNHLRGLELALAAEAPPPVRASLGKAAIARSASVPSIGSTESLHVLSGLSGGGYTDVVGRVACVTAQTIFYVDTEVDRKNPKDLSADDVNGLCEKFQKAIEVEFSLFGQPSDINGDQHIAVLMTPQVNRLGSSQGGIITGFFFANDLYPGRSSNSREILYIMVPDTAGLYGLPIEKSFAMNNLIPAVMVHELQHAINYNTHVLAGQGKPEEAWLNEGLSHLAEDLLGYGIENPARYALYLQRPEIYGLVTAGSPGLAERGGIFLLLRYLYEQHGDGKQLVWDLLHSPATGVANIEAAYASTDEGFDQFSEFLIRWGATLLLNNRGISADPRFQYADRLQASTGYWQGVCTICDADDNRGTVLSGVKRASYMSKMGVSLEPAATQYYLIDTVPAQINIAAPSSAPFGAVLIRTK
ncbi:MAG: hypothetical protein HYV03_07715 [Deltaproteobacteria bacterium]|nr:hypothetical protein [Deltaproteobacteria bacterium]